MTRAIALATLVACSGATRTATPTPTPTPPSAAPSSPTLSPASCPVGLFFPLSIPAEHPLLAAVWPACKIEDPPNLLRAFCPEGGCDRECREELPLGPIEYGYDGDGHLTLLTAAHSRPLSYEYRDGRLVAIAHGKHTSQLRYEGDRVVEETGDQGTVRWTYDAAGRITAQTTTADGKASATTFAYEPDGRLRSHTSGTSTWTYAYDADGRVSRITSGDSAHVYTYRPDGRLDHLELLDHGSVWSRIDYTYDGRGRLTEERAGPPDGQHRDTIRHVYDCATPAAQ